MIAQVKEFAGATKAPRIPKSGVISTGLDPVWGDEAEDGGEFLRAGERHVSLPPW